MNLSLEPRVLFAYVHLEKIEFLTFNEIFDIFHGIDKVSKIINNLSEARGGVELCSAVYLNDIEYRNILKIGRFVWHSGDLNNRTIWIANFWKSGIQMHSSYYFPGKKIVQK